MPIARVLDAVVCPDLAAYEALGGGSALAGVRASGADGALASLAAAGLRGRGGAGFPTHEKWASIIRQRGSGPGSVVVNAAEGEPGTFKDRAILRANPYRVLEGALIAATIVGASEVVVAMKGSFRIEITRVGRALDELRAAGWTNGANCRVVLGPNAYLFGEETALLEVVEGRLPFPRVAPPYREGLPADSVPAPVALVNNVETFANVPLILANGPAWFRSVGTAQSPGTIVCTITGDTTQHGVIEVAMGTTLRAVIEEAGGGVLGGRHVRAVLSGVSNGVLRGEDIDTPLTHEDMAAVGSGLGCAGFIVFDDRRDPIAIAQAAARFLAVESCGQCEPCKRDGLEIARRLDAIARSDATQPDALTLGDRAATVADGARCFLASQQQRIAESVLRRFHRELDHHARGAPPATPVTVAPLVDIAGARDVIDHHHAGKQPDWSYDATDSGGWPAARPVETRVNLATEHPTRERRGDAMARADSSRRLRELELLHDDVEQALSAAARATDGSRPRDASRRLDALVRVYIDVSDRVLYPMVRRVAGDEGEVIAGEGESLERAVIGALDEHPSDGLAEDAAAAELIGELLGALEHRLVRALQDHMEVAAIEHLDLALAEAKATVVPGSQRGQSD